MSSAEEAPASLLALLRDQAHASKSPSKFLTPKSRQVEESLFDDSPSFGYLEKLTSLSLSSIQALPPSLAQDAQSLHSSLSSLCLRHANTFIRVHDANSSLLPALAAAETELDAMLDLQIDQLADKVETFQANAEHPLDRRRSIAELMSIHEDSLSGLLDVPHLVQLCISARRIDEALQLSAHLTNFFSSVQDNARELDVGQEGFEVIRELLREVKQSLTGLQQHLIQSWSGPGLKLPSAKRALSQLKLLAVISDEIGASDRQEQHAKGTLNHAKLHLAFLRARTSVVQGRLIDALHQRNHEVEHLAKAAKVSPAESGALVNALADTLRKYINIWREGVLDVLSMATALFGSESVKGHRSVSEDLIIHTQGLTSSAADFFSSQLAQTLSKHLGLCLQVRMRSETRLLLAEHLADLHRQLRYASIACSRFGFDFAPVLRRAASTSGERLTTLEGIGIQLFEQSVVEAEESISKDMSAGLDKVIAACSILNILAASGMENEQVNQEAPPSYVSWYSILARYCNGLADALTALAAFAPLTSKRATNQILQRSLEQISSRWTDALDVLQGQNTLSSGLSPQISTALSSDEELTMEEVAVRHKEATELLTARLVSCWATTITPWALNALHKGIYNSSHDIAGVGSSTSAEHLVDWAQTKEKAWSSAEEERQKLLQQRRRDKEEAEAAAVAAIEDERLAQEAAEVEARRLAEERAVQLGAEAAAKRKAEADAKAEAKRKAEDEAAAVAAAVERERKAEEEAEGKRRKEVQEGARREANAAPKARPEAEAEAKAAAEAEAKAKAKVEAEAKAKGEAEAKAKAEAEAKAAAEVAEVGPKAEAKVNTKVKEEAEAKSDAGAKLKAETNVTQKGAEELAARRQAEEEKAAAPVAAEAGRSRSEDAVAAIDRHAKNDVKGQDEEHQVDERTQPQEAPSTSAPPSGTQTPADATEGEYGDEGGEPEPPVTPTSQRNKNAKKKQKKKQKRAEAAAAAVAEQQKKAATASTSLPESAQSLSSATESQCSTEQKEPAKEEVAASAPPAKPTGKLSLAEKLKIKQEQRQREQQIAEKRTS
ncbi:hypothetical protein K437DRAFT_254462 [Tilletiaria anomala UBC 951]|uniref:Conserved oligomeric Golgi complex subunit 8 n=1 Tax=Tilletiaria anomala (strain ATCC 24038 / CBS 436.72 / UBC 951) TaxID=1037660 RepID=A0A066WMN9_TILAU|nr:uncharacterized protein K437DRAFT_254462 [Tilletiaria anomala UBC 951]KDN52274.1 hypothetical protein K437DRAFT_254462 [Tilletiaria anomala UBC 951]